jgi:hypothetical protein
VRPVSRVMPAGHPGLYQTYRILQPSDQRVITACEEAGCDNWRHGWDTKVDEGTTLGKLQAAHIRAGKTGRAYKEMRAKGLTVFRFEPHQRCFADHLTRAQLFEVAGGDWRGNPRKVPTRRHALPADWVEDFGDHQGRLLEQIRKG